MGKQYEKLTPLLPLMPSVLPSTHPAPCSGVHGSQAASRHCLDEHIPFPNAPGSLEALPKLLLYFAFLPSCLSL